MTQENIGAVIDGSDIVFEECDSLDLKVLIRVHAKKQRVPVVMVTSERGMVPLSPYFFLSFVHLYEELDLLIGL